MGYKDRNKQREYQRLRNAAIRKEWLDVHGPCVKCGSERELQVDHIDPRLKISHNVWSWTPERREAELAKCQVLCYACHKLKTKAEHKARGRHGTVNMYRRHKCRCDLCVKAKSIENAKRTRPRSIVECKNL